VASATTSGSLTEVQEEVELLQLEVKETLTMMMMMICTAKREVIFINIISTLG